MRSAPDDPGGRAASRRRRGAGEGAIYCRADGKWVGALDLGWKSGRRQRKVVYGRTQAEVRNKLRSLHSTLDAGLPLPDDRLTVGELLERFLTDVAPDRVSASTLDNYRRVVKHHLVPVLGRRRLVELTPIEVQRLLRSKSSE